MSIGHRFARSLNEPSAKEALSLATHVQTELKYPGPAVNQLCQILQDLHDTKSSNWVHKMLDKITDPFLILFGRGGLQLCTVELDRFDIFQKLCQNWMPIVEEAKKNRNQLDAPLYRELNQQRKQRFDNGDHSLAFDVGLSFGANLKDKTWEWIEAYLPIYLYNHTLEEARSEILGLPRDSREKARKMAKISALCNSPIEWKELTTVREDPALLNSLVEIKGGWNNIPLTVLYEIMHDSIYTCKVQTIELLLDNRPDLSFKTSSIIKCFLDFESHHLYDDPITDRLIRKWQLTGPFLNENFAWMKGDFQDYPAISRLLARYAES